MVPRFLLLLSLLLPTSACAGLEIVDAWIKNLPPGVPLRAGYMTIRNTGQVTVRILALRSAAFASIEIHRSLVQDGMVRMDPVESLSIAAGASLQLAPGGYHLMMMQPVAATRPGQAIEVILQLDDGTEQHLTMIVVK